MDSPTTQSQFLQQLREFGLNEREASVYAALFELNQSVVTPIASKARINRTTAYNVLESLVSKKLVTKSSYRGKHSYALEDPNQFLASLEEERTVLENKIAEAKKLQAKVKSLFTEKYTKPMIKYVDGFDGIIQLYEDSLTCKDPEGLRAYTSLRDLKEEMGAYAEKYFERRKNRGIKIRSMVPDTEYGKEIKRVQHLFLRDTRLIPKEKFDFSPEIYLYDDKFAVMSLKEKFGFMLQSKEIVEALKKAWDLAWERAEQYDKEIKM